MSSPTPALVTQRGARRLPRLALLIFCAAYVLPGVFDRGPWRSADVTAFGVMAAMAEGRTAWLAPTLGGVMADAAPLPHGLGALFIWLLSPMLAADVAARLPFALLLTLTLALVWYTTFHLARTEAAQPVAFAFGGEAEPVDYARAIADGALLALIATLGLLQLGHETTPELAQLFGMAMFLWALASAPYRHGRSRVAVVVALLVLAGSGAPAMATVAGLAGSVVCRRSRFADVQRYAVWVLAATIIAAGVAWRFDLWHLRTVALGLADLPGLLRQWAWFLWPVWPLVLWTLWRWRHHLLDRHLAVPLVAVLTATTANIAMHGSDRALMLALPGMAVLAAFALPTFKRSTSAAIDWFSMCFFSLAAIVIWVVYVALHTGTPPQPARNVAKLAPGFIARFELPELLVAIAATMAWLWLVRWRTGRHREAVWKSMVLPAGGVALCWLLLMTLWLPLLDYARSSRPLVSRIAAHVAPGECIAGPTLSLPLVAALEAIGGYRVEAGPRAVSSRCAVLIQVSNTGPARAAPPGWERVAALQRPTDRTEITAVYRRQAPRPPLPADAPAPPGR